MTREQSNHEPRRWLLIAWAPVMLICCLGALVALGLLAFGAVLYTAPHSPDSRLAEISIETRCMRLADVFEVFVFFTLAAGLPFLLARFESFAHARAVILRACCWQVLPLTGLVFLSLTTAGIYLQPASVTVISLRVLVSVVLPVIAGVVHRSRSVLFWCWVTPIVAIGGYHALQVLVFAVFVSFNAVP